MNRSRDGEGVSIKKKKKLKHIETLVLNKQFYLEFNLEHEIRSKMYENFNIKLNFKQNKEMMSLHYNSQPQFLYIKGLLSCSMLHAYQ